VAIKDLKTINSQDYELSTIQRNTSEFAQQLIGNPLLDGNLLKDIAVSVTATEFAHGLGRKPQGYIVVKASTGVTLSDSASLTPNTTIKLTASASSTVSIWVF
jgi:hypothetical protein